MVVLLIYRNTAGMLKLPEVASKTVCNISFYIKKRKYRKY